MRLNIKHDPDLFESPSLLHFNKNMTVIIYVSAFSLSVFLWNLSRKGFFFFLIVLWKCDFPFITGEGQIIHCSALLYRRWWYRVLKLTKVFLCYSFWHNFLAVALLLWLFIGSWVHSKDETRFWALISLLAKLWTPLQQSCSLFRGRESIPGQCPQRSYS